MKKFDIKDVFRFGNAEKAKEYVGKLGYFGDSLEDINKWVQKYPPNFLFQILGKDEKKRFMIDDPEVYIFKLFLPAIKVKEVAKPKKWRAFKDFEELSETLNKGVGSEIIYRTKKEPLRKITTSIVGFITEDNREDFILIGMSALPLSTYFEEIEIWNNVEKRWNPFGVLENE